MTKFLKAQLLCCLSVAIVFSSAALAQADYNHNDCDLELPWINHYCATSHYGSDADTTSLFIIGVYGNKVKVIVTASGYTKNYCGQKKAYLNDPIVYGNLLDYLDCKANQLTYGYKCVKSATGYSLYIVKSPSYWWSSNAHAELIAAGEVTLQPCYY